jgi:PAS domain S-box-containing protein
VLYSNVAGTSILEEWKSLPGQPVPDEWRRIIDGVLHSGERKEVERSHGDRTFWYILVPFPGSGYVNIYGMDLTERKRAEEALREAHTYLNHILQSVSDAFYALDRGWRFTYVNQQAMKMTGWSAVELRGRTIWEVFPSILGTPLEAAYRKAMAEGVPVRLDNMSSVVKGNWFEVDIHPMKDGITIFGRDITDRKQAEEALHDTSQYLENLINHANAPIIVWDTGLRITRFNHAFERLTGRSADEVMGQRLEILFPAETVDDSMDHIRRVMAGERWEAVEIPILNKDGGIRTVLWNSATLYGADGKTVSSAIAQGQDITERKLAEEETRRLLRIVQEEKDRLSALINSISDEVWFADTERKFTLTNPPALHEFGIGSEGEIDVEKFVASLEVYYPDGRSRPVEEAPPLRALSGETIRNQMEIVRTPATGELRYRQVSSSPVRDAGGAIIGSVSVVSDVTERKKAEDAVLSAKKQVEEALEILRALYDNAPIGFAFVDPEFRYLHINDTLADMNGIPARDHIGRTVESIAPWLWPSVVSTFQEVLRTGVPAGDIDLSGEVPSALGEKKHWLGNVYRVQARDGQVIGIGVTLADITERKRAEVEVREKARELEKAGIELGLEIEQRKQAEEGARKALSILHAALESTADAMLVVDRSGRITSYNQNFTTMWNIPDAVLHTLDTRAAGDFVSAQLRDPDAFLARLQEILNHPLRESYDMLELLDGRIIERYSKPQRIGNTIVGRVFSYRDVTERKRAEERLITSLDEKEVLLREIHHRVKNNLQLTTSLLDMTRMRTTDPGTGSILTDVMMKIQTMAQIHTRLYESKQFDRINMGGQIRDQVRALASIYGGSDREITVEIDSPELYLPLDQAIPCALALNEILSNAYKHAFRGRKSGTVQYSAEEVDGRIRFTIRDDGIGLPGEFDLNRANTLGLKLVRTLVQQQLRGTLEMKRRKQGTEVIVELPREGKEEDHVKDTRG